MKLWQGYVSLVENLFRPFLLLVAKFHFKKRYPEVDLSSFSTVRLRKMCNVWGRFPDVDIPLLSDEELDRLNTETNWLNAKATAKAAWWVVVKAPVEAAKNTASGITQGRNAFNNLMAPLNKISNSSEEKVSSKPYESGLAMSAASEVETLESEIKRYQEKYEMALRSGGAAPIDPEVYLSMLNEKKKRLSGARESLKMHREHDSIRQDIRQQPKK